MKRLLGIATAVLLIGHANAVHAQSEVTLIAPQGISAALKQLIPIFEKKTGIKVKATDTFGSGARVKQQVASGEAFDVAVIQPPYPEVLDSGNVVKTSGKTLAVLAIGVAVKKGAPKPDMSTPEAVKRMLLAAKSIASPGGALGKGPPGIAFATVLEKLGITDQITPKIKSGGATPIHTMVANGDVEIGLTFMSELEDPGTDIVGPFPKELAPRTAYDGFVSAHAKNPAAAKKLLAFFASREAASAYTAQHMEPGKGK